MHYQFSPPQSSTSPIPFDNLSSLHTWLDNLTTLDNTCRCQEILCVLQTLKKTHLSHKDHFTTLERIHAHLTRSIKQFDKRYWDSKFPLKPEQRYQIEIITWIFAELASNYLQLAKQSSKKIVLFPNKKKLAFLLHQALQASSQVYLKISSCYALPYPGFWKSVYEMYFFAEKHALLNTVITSNKHEKSTFKELFTNILLLSLCDMHQFRPRDMYQIYDFLKFFTDRSDIKIAYNYNDQYKVRSFHQYQDSSPIPKAIKTKRGFISYRYLVMTDTINAIFNELSLTQPLSSNLNKFNQAIFLRAYKSLKSTQKRQLTRISKPSNTTKGLIGFSSIIKFHWENSYHEDIQYIFAPNNSDTTTLSKPSQAHLLVDPIDNSQHTDIMVNELKHHDIFNTHQSALQERRNTVRFEEFEIIDSTLKGHQILWNSCPEKLQIGNVFSIICNTTQNIEIGLVRRINSTENNLLLGIELLSIKSSATYFCSPNTPEQKISCIILNQDSLLYSVNHLQSGDTIFLFINQKKVLCHLGQSLHSTASVSHFELLFPHEQPLGIS
jgi:hypothetical protein